MNKSELEQLSNLLEKFNKEYSTTKKDDSSYARLLSMSIWIMLNPEKYNQICKNVDEESL